jgi:hypothetical protein
MSKVRLPDETLVTLSCDETLPLETRVELLAYAFAKMVQGSILKKIVEWDITNGRIAFVLSHLGIHKVPVGQVMAKLENTRASGLTMEVQKIGRG